MCQAAGVVEYVWLGLLYAVRDFDDAATRHWFGFASVDEYYAAASSGYHLHAVDTPLLCIRCDAWVLD